MSPASTSRWFSAAAFATLSCALSGIRMEFSMSNESGANACGSVWPSSRQEEAVVREPASRLYNLMLEATKDQLSSEQNLYLHLHTYQ